MSETAFEKWLDSISDGLGPDLPAKPEDIARTAWNAAIDAAVAECLAFVSAQNNMTKESTYRMAGALSCREKIQKLRSE